MLRNRKLKNSNRVWQLVHTLTAVLVFSYIAFDVLDLDLSDFPLKQVPYKQMVLVIEVPKGTELSNMLDPDGLRMNPSVLDPSIFKESIRLQHKEKLRASHFRMNRIHVLRLTLPRSSTLDSSRAA